jgi:hypothetical protein
LSYENDDHYCNNICNDARRSSICTNRYDEEPEAGNACADTTCGNAATIADLADSTTDTTDNDAGAANNSIAVANVEQSGYADWLDTG